MRSFRAFPLTRKLPQRISLPGHRRRVGSPEEVCSTKYRIVRRCVGAEMERRKVGGSFVALDEESSAVSEGYSLNQNLWDNIYISFVQSFQHIPSYILALLGIVVCVSLVGIYSSNPHISETNGEEFATEWDVTPYRYDFLVESPYGREPDPYYKIFMPLYTTHPLHEVNSQITSVVVSIHGYSRNPDVYFRTAVDAVRSDPRILVVLPYFSQNQLYGSQWGRKHHGYGSASLYWNTSGWMKGGNASPSPSRFSSSFDVMDDILKQLADLNLFPSLRKITIAGYSAGSQFASHYAWATQYNITASNSQIHLQYLLSGSSSFLYFTGHRPSQSCIQEYSLGLKNECQEYEIPSGEYLNSCLNYDHWKYGLSSFPAEGYNYLQRYVGDAEAVKEHTNRYRNKDIRYIVGDHDTCNCNTEGYANEGYCYNIIDGPREINTDDGPANDDDGDLTPIPTLVPSSAPSPTPSIFPSSSPSVFPSHTPSTHPSTHPSTLPSTLPSSSIPTSIPTAIVIAEEEAEVSSTPNDVICLPVHSSHESCCDTYPDAYHNLLSLTCGSNFQGSNRLQRAVLYLQYLKILWKEFNYTPPVEYIHGMGHDRIKFFNSKTFQELISFEPEN